MLVLLNSLVCDYFFRAKFTSGHVKQYQIHQLPVPAATSLSDNDLAFIASRAVELTYTSHGLKAFAEDLGYDGPSFRWDPERRALLRGELGAYCAYLYGLTRRELRYIVDPKDVMGEDYPSETFRVLKENEIQEHGLDEKGMWRTTQRLVLDAYDCFAQNGTFDPARLEDPEYFPVVRAALTASKSREQELERTLEGLMARSDREALPTLFVERATDKLIVEAAWRALFPSQPLPISVLPAGGTTQMKSLATSGKAMRKLPRRAAGPGAGRQRRRGPRALERGEPAQGRPARTATRRAMRSSTTRRTSCSPTT
jgi:hypothetical protein